MTSKMKPRHTILPLLLMAATSAGAQDLNKEITIDRDIVPAQRAAARPVVFPSVIPPSLTPVTLTMGETDRPVGITPGISPYEPAADNGAFPVTPWRGYADLGYFPLADIGLSAGYAIIDKEATRLDIWLQADHRSYKSPDGHPLKVTRWEDFSWKTLDIAGGVKFSQRFGRHNLLKVTTDLGYSTTSVPDLWHNREGVTTDLPADAAPSRSLGNFRWHIDGMFTGRAGERITYAVGAGFGLFNNRSQQLMMSVPDDNTLPKTVNQTSARLDASLRHQTTGNVALGIKVEGEMLSYSSFLTPALMGAAIADREIIIPGGKTLAQIDFIPAVEYNGGSFYGKAGARLGLSVNSGSSFHIAPDILVGVNPSASFGAWVKLRGGVQGNSLEDLFFRSRYADPRLAYDLSNVAFTGQLGVRVGPFKGASLTLTADYAAANDWLMPLQVEDHAGNLYNLFAPSKIRAIKFGAEIAWQYRSLLTLALSYECNPGDGDNHAWLYWADRARHVAGASLSVTPISPLTIDLGFTARLDRREWMESAGGMEQINDQDYILNQPYATSHKLGDLTNLWAGASWRFTPSLTVFARFDNILSKRAQLVFGVPNQGFTGLFGLGYKF